MARPFIIAGVSSAAFSFTFFPHSLSHSTSNWRVRCSADPVLDARKYTCARCFSSSLKCLVVSHHGVSLQQWWCEDCFNCGSAIFLDLLRKYRGLLLLIFPQESVSRSFLSNFLLLFVSDSYVVVIIILVNMPDLFPSFLVQMLMENIKKQMTVRLLELQPFEWLYSEELSETFHGRGDPPCSLG